MGGVYVISVAAQLCGVHPQTLRVWESAGLVLPERTAGKTRRYSEADIAILKRVVELSAAGVNIEGISRILVLEKELHLAHREVAALRGALNAT